MRELFKLIADYREKWAAQAECFGPGYERKLADEAEDLDAGSKKFEEWANSKSEGLCYEGSGSVEEAGKDSGSESTSTKKSKKDRRKVKAAEKASHAEAVEEASHAEAVEEAGHAKAVEEASQKASAEDLDGELLDLTPDELEELRRLEEKIAELEVENSYRPWVMTDIIAVCVDHCKG